MRLLDHVAQSTAPCVVEQHDGTRWSLPGTSDFAATLRRCPLRYVLSDELVRTCIALAYSDGDELGGCLDLVHFPAEALWIEWDETARQIELARCLGPGAPGLSPGAALRAGMLLRAEPSCRSGQLRTFWLDSAVPREPVLAPVQTLLDLDGGGSAAPAMALLDGAAVSVGDPASKAIDALLRCARFRLDEPWRRYYLHAARDEGTRRQVITRSLAAVAFDVPLLFALCLLLAVRDDLQRRPVSLARLNAKRTRAGRPPLLEHLEISAPVFTAPAPWQHAEGPGTRRGPRLHHVRGHLVRREDSVYWRAPHWRGHMRLGRVRSRTVALRLSGSSLQEERREPVAIAAAERKTRPAP